MPSSKSAKAKPQLRFDRSQRFNSFTVVGVGFIALSLTLLLAIFWPVILEELRFNTKNVTPVTSTVAPIDTEFGIVIPKIGANAKVIPNVDPYDSRIYQRALTKSVAHAKGSGLPGQTGNIFLFSHSSVNFYEASRYNSVFYLLTKLEEGDKIELYYQGTKFDYMVIGKKNVVPTAIEYLAPREAGRETLTLMTCWPPGTTYKRLLVIAERKE